MPENNDFEKAMQQQLEGFRVTPAPRDWNAVYEQLHPNKKQRPFWWWLPAVLLMVAVGWYISKEPNGAGQSSLKTNNAEIALQQESTDKTKAVHAEGASVATVNEIKKQGQKNEEPENELASSSSKIKNDKNGNAENLEMKMGEATAPKTNKNASAKNKLQTGGAVANTQHQSQNNGAENEVKQTAGEAVFNNATSTVTVEETAIFPTYNLATLHWANAAKKVTAANWLQPPIPAAQMATGAPQKNSAAVKNNIAKWQWGLYAGAGVNRLTQPISMMKAQSDNMSSGPSSARLMSTTHEQNGWHYNAGFFVNRKWNRNWQFTTGLGINASTWKSTVTTYADSFGVANTLYSRTLVSTVENNNKLLMAELPLQISNRIAGKGSSTFWWTAGINNQWLINLKQQTTSSRLSNNFSATTDEKKLTNGVNKYQPQLRAGFMFDYAGKKSHWQLQPLLNLSLVRPLQSDNFNLMNLQLQGRWFFGKK